VIFFLLISVSGLRNGLKPFNLVNGLGEFENFPPFNGLKARKDDAKFVELLKKQNALLFSHDFEHDYPFGERSKEPVIFKTTKQWFFKYVLLSLFTLNIHHLQQ